MRTPRRGRRAIGAWFEASCVIRLLFAKASIEQGGAQSGFTFLFRPGLAGATGALLSAEGFHWIDSGGAARRQVARQECRSRSEERRVGKERRWWWFAGG